MIDLEYCFKNQEAWENWLNDHYMSEDGISICFDKTKKTSSLTGEEALDVALRYGWIDGRINSIDQQFYLKYFKKRSKNSIWSTKNKNRVNELTSLGMMMPSGLEAVELAKADGRWEKGDSLPEEFDIDRFKEILKSLDEEGYRSFIQFSPSVQKTYAISYFALKKQESRDKRLKVIVERSKNHLKPME